MSCRVTLPIWPTSLDCLSWSKDNLIAVGGGDSIAIFSPRFKEPGVDGTYWAYAVFKANAFTAKEIPLSDPLSLVNFSVGEELSLRNVQALEWSSPGLASHGRCVLAVLSSNHVLSIWECDGRPDLGSNWKRKAIVNHALRRHYDSMLKKHDGETDQELHERKQVSQRIRAFTWSPPVYKEWGDEDSSFTPFLDRGHQFLAVSTEAENILLLRVMSPHNLLMPEVAEWNVEVVTCFNSGFSAREGLQVGLSNDQCDDHPCNDHSFIADHLAWGGWSWEQGGFGDHAPFAFIADGRLFLLTVEGEPYTKFPEARLPSNCEVKNFVPSRSDVTGPLKFTPKTRLLTAFATDRIFCVDTSADPTEDSSLTSHDLDDRWDEISGVAPDANGAEPPRVHITSHLSSATASTTTLSLPLDKDETSSQPSWQEAIIESRATFSAQWNLDGNVQERTWGIASSPLGEYIATATSMLPSDSVAYMTPSDQWTVVNITREISQPNEEILPIEGGIARPSDVTAESLLFSLQRYLDRQMSNPMDSETLVQGMMKTLAPPKDFAGFDGENVLLSGGWETVQVVRYLKLRMFMLPDMMSQRVKLLVDIALRRISNANQISRSVIQHLVSEVLRLPNDIEQGGELSDKIRRLYKVVKSKLEPTHQSHADVETWKEECRMCQKSVLFESLKWAKCEGGHQFSRCAMTFLAIQEPGLSKHCTICESQFLNEWSLPAFTKLGGEVNVEIREAAEEVEQPKGDRPSPDAGWVEVSQSNTAATEPASSLARILFAAFDTCIYCGGKFVT